MIVFEPLFSKSVFEHARLMLLGALLAPGKRTVSAILRVTGRGQERRFHKYHRVLSLARWSALQGAQLLLLRLLAIFDTDPRAPLVFGIDDTIERRRGQKIRAKGIYRDPVRSSKRHFAGASGLRWISLMWLVPIAWAGRVWALPFLTALAPSERYHSEQGRPHKKLTDWARQMTMQLRRWLPRRALIVTGDNTFSSLEFLAAVSAHVTFVTRLRLDAALYEPAPTGKPGRPRKKGKRLPKLEAVLIDPNTRWQPITVSQWYARQNQKLEITTGTAVWYHPGKPVVPIRWVLIRDPKGKLAPSALLSTCLDVESIEVIQWFVRRWSVEVTFEEARAHLGLETQRQWSDQAIARTTPVLLGLFSVVTLLADQLKEQDELYVRTAAWYEKVLRLGHQEQVRQPLRLPREPGGRHQARHRRDDRRQGRLRGRLRRRGQGLSPGPACP
jgi:hypothetical protein